MSVFTTVLFLQHAGGSRPMKVNDKRAQEASYPVERPKVVCDDPAKRNILLVGTSGRGKSSTGNLIFGEAEPVFKTSDSMETKPDKIDCEMRVIDGLTIKVCDALTIPDERLLPNEAHAKITARLNKCFAACPEGFHFIIFVFSYINRVTPEEHVAAEILIKMFGEEFLKRQAITVFTHGDDFDLKKARSRVPDFDTWYREAKDPLLQTFSSYMKAILLYDPPLNEMLKQRKEILEAIRKCITEGEQHGLQKRARFGQDQWDYQRKPGDPNVQAKTTSDGAKMPTLNSTPQKESSRETARECDVEIFLLGKSGHGKSSTGNTILGREAFKSSDLQGSSTLETDVGWTTRKGLTIKVVDGPGLLDTRLTGQKQLEQLQQNVSKGFVHSPNGFHALVLVLKYGTRFTEDEKKTVKLLKDMLGSDFTEKHCILVFTDGESFSMKYRNKNFLDWCQQAGSDLSPLVQECNNRVVLFHNQTPEKAEESTDQLISFAKGLKERYTAEIFQQIAAKRAQFIQDHGFIQLEEPIQAKISLIINYLEKHEIGRDLNQVVKDLEEEIGKEKSSVRVVKEVKKGILQTKCKEYDLALRTFQDIEYEGKVQIKSFSQQVLGAVKGIFQGFANLFL